MSNLNIENLSRIVQTGDTEAFMGQSSAAGEMKVRREMQNQGMQITGDGNAAGAGAAAGAGGAAGHGTTFADILQNSVDQVNQFQTQADTAIKELVAGRNKNIHETMLTIERADTSLKLMMQVRNKILDAYREIMRMQV